jgi:hypothetical protein
VKNPRLDKPVDPAQLDHAIARVTSRYDAGSDAVVEAG